MTTTSIPATETFAALKRSQFINLTTFRKSGAAVVTPVWFAEANGKLYGTTGFQAGKLKRIRNNPKVTVAPCTVSGKPLGDAVEAKARILPPEEFQLANNALKRKYGLQYLFLTFSMKLRGGKQIFWEVSPN